MKLSKQFALQLQKSVNAYGKKQKASLPIYMGAGNFNGRKVAGVDLHNGQVFFCCNGVPVPACFSKLDPNKFFELSAVK